MGKDKKRHKKKSSVHKKHHKKTYKSSSDDSSSSEEWVENINAAPSPDTKQLSPQQKRVPEQDDWASNPALFAGISRDQLRQKKDEKCEQDKYMLDKLGQTNRELNPYWKDGGSGLPQESPVTVESLRQSHVTVGDQGAAWLRKALQRAKEQAQDSGRPLDEVVAERWGSLEKLESMIAAAEECDRNKKYSVIDDLKFHKNDHRDKKYSSGQYTHTKHHEKDKDIHRKIGLKKSFFKSCDSSEESNSSEKKRRYKKEFERKKDSSCNKSDINRDKEKTKKTEEVFKRAKEKVSSESSHSSSEDITKKYKYSKQRYREKHNKRFSKPRSSSNSSNNSTEEERKHRSSNYKKSSRRFSKPANSSDEGKRTHRESEQNKSSHDSRKRKFVRPYYGSEEENDTYKSKSSESKTRDYKLSSYSRGGWRKKVETEKKDDVVEKKIDVKIEEKSICETKEDGKIDEAEPVLTDKEMNELAAKLVKAELLGDQERVDELKSKLAKAREVKANAPKNSDVTKEVVILTHTDAKGFTRPVSLSGPLEPSGGRRKARKVETHSDGKRMRYFADDDKYTLQEMFQREKLQTVEDSNEVFAKLASKGIGRDDSARDMEDVFEETARVEENEGRQKARERDRAVEQTKRTAKSLDNCQWCLESQHMLKHLIVAIGTTCYLCVPPYQSLTENHCLIVPRAHTPCATQLDEDVWTEIQDFRKALVQMFLSQDEDVVFFESARRLNQFPHMILNCVPVPKEIGDMAPIYFKKAIQECEQEWSNNKKLVDLRGRDVRRAVPKGLPYFSVDFGLDSGYAHVIEDEQLFPQNFAQEIIGGMLDLDHSIWRKQRRQPFEEQSKKVIQLSKLWNPFDFLKKK